MKVFNSATQSRFLFNFIEKENRKKLVKLMGIMSACLVGLSILEALPPTKTTEPEFLPIPDVEEIVTVVEEPEQESDIRERILSSIIKLSYNSITVEKAEVILSLVEEHCSWYGFELSTVLGLIAQESHFKSKARSHADARGLMQVTPIALRDFNRIHGTDYTEQDLYNDGINLMIGCWTLDRQRKYIGSNDMDECIISYNSGAGNFRRNRTDYLTNYTYLNKVKEYRSVFLECGVL